MFKTGREEDAKRAQDNGRVGRRALYQMILLEHAQSHLGVDGKMTPWIFRAPGGLHDDIVGKMRTKTVVRILDPVHGRPLVIRKKKTGPQTFDVEWSVDDLDPAPLDPWYYPVFQNLWDLTKFVKPPKLADQLTAIQAMGFPVPEQLPQLAQQEAQQEAQQAMSQGQQLPGQTQQQLPGQTQQQLPGQTLLMQPQQQQGHYAYQPQPNAPYVSPYPQQAAPGVPPQLANLQMQMRG
jgi:hypothetical protein